MRKNYTFDKRARCRFRRMTEAPERLRELRADCILALTKTENPDTKTRLRTQLEEIENLLTQAELMYSLLKK